jgi:CDP-diacylglycerol--glycerol-3-phosphate 3-phosphatidyltransferase
VDCLYKTSDKRKFSEVLQIENLANMITVTRLIGAMMLPFTVPFSLPFWVLYIYCGVSDFIDGLVARAMKQQSEAGAKLDSVADAAFFFAILIAVIPAVVIPTWIWICAAVIALVRVSAYLIGYKKYHKFSALHTCANKLTGGFLFCSPVLYTVFGVTAAGAMLCLLAMLSSCEELLITVLSKNLDRNCKGIFVR